MNFVRSSEDLHPFGWEFFFFCFWQIIKKKQPRSIKAGPFPEAEHLDLEIHFILRMCSARASYDIAVFLCLEHLLIASLNTNADTFGTCAIENQEQILWFPSPCILQPGVHMSLCMVGTMYWRLTCILSLCSSATSMSLSLSLPSAAVKRFSGEA